MKQMIGVKTLGADLLLAFKAEQDKVLQVSNALLQFAGFVNYVYHGVFVVTYQPSQVLFHGLFIINVFAQPQVNVVDVQHLRRVYFGS